MRHPLTAAEWAEELRNFQETAFRLEMQPAYSVPWEAEALARFLSGGEPRPTDEPAFRDWLDQVAGLVAGGRRIERVRIHDDPPTPYQRYVRWVGSWNKRAGEELRYMTRDEALRVGLPATDTVEWWLMDSKRLIVMRFDHTGRHIDDELVTDPEQIEQACTWRDLAVHHSAPDIEV